MIVESACLDNVPSELYGCPRTERQWWNVLGRPLESVYVSPTRDVLRAGITI